MLKGSILREDVTILNVYAPNNTVSNYVRHKLVHLHGGINETTITVKDFNTPLSEMDRSSNKDIGELNNAINQLDIINISRLLNLKIGVYTFFSSSHEYSPI